MNRRAESFQPLASLTNQNFGGWVIDSDGFEDGRAIIGHGHRAALPPTQQDFILQRRKRSGEN